MTELSVGTDECSVGELFVHSRNSDRPAACFLNHDVYIVRVWKYPAGVAVAGAFFRAEKENGDPQ
jgi:hypothetical protein